MFLLLASASATWPLADRANMERMQVDLEPIIGQEHTRSGPPVLSRSLGAWGTVDAVDMSDLLTLMLVLLGVLSLLGVAVIGFVMWRYRVPPRGLIAMIGALVYLASPVDVLPEAMLGPFGLLDDAGAVTAAAVFVYKLVTVKRRLADAGVKGRRRPDLLE